MCARGCPSYLRCGGCSFFVSGARRRTLACLSSSCVRGAALCVVCAVRSCAFLCHARLNFFYRFERLMMRLFAGSVIFIPSCVFVRKGGVCQHKLKPLAYAGSDECYILVKKGRQSTCVSVLYEIVAFLYSRRRLTCRDARSAGPYPYPS